MDGLVEKVETIIGQDSVEVVCKFADRTESHGIHLGPKDHAALAQAVAATLRKQALG